jgi:hypothetical protein
MKKILKIGISTILLILVFSSCEKIETDLNVDSKNDPDINTIASDKVALEATANNIFRNWFMAVTNYYGPGAAMKTMADEATCSWGNAGMKDLSSEPRVAFNNSESYSYEYITSSYFNALYSILSDANLLVKAVDENLADFDNPDNILMAGKMGQGLAVGYLAMVFDRTWLPGDSESSNHEEAMQWALDRMDEAIALANNGASLDPSAIPNADTSGPAMAKLLNSLAARMLVNNPRNSNQRDQIDWNRVKNYAENGLDYDFTIFMDDTSWYDLIPKTYLVYPGWARVDLRVIHLMDNAYPDYWEDTFTTLPEANSNDARLASDYQYLTSNNFRPERGLYHFSSYRYSRYDQYITDWVMDLVEYEKAENDMYLAEAKLYLGDVAGAADIVNASTRTTRGNLPPVAANFQDVKDAIFYERMVEFGFSTPIITFAEMRKEDLLQAGTLLHFPVPAKALASIPEPPYTYGGDQGVPGEDVSVGGWR